MTNRRSIRTVASLTFVSLYFVLCPSLAMADWEHIYEDDGVNVYRQEVAGTNLLAFRGTGFIDAPVNKVLHVFSDVKHEIDWVDRYSGRFTSKMNHFSVYDHVYVF